MKVYKIDSPMKNSHKFKDLNFPSNIDSLDIIIHIDANSTQMNDIYLFDRIISSRNSFSITRK